MSKHDDLMNALKAQDGFLPLNVQLAYSACRDKDVLVLEGVDKNDLKKGQCYVYVNDSGDWQLNEYASHVGIAGGKRSRYRLPEVK